MASASVTLPPELRQKIEFCVRNSVIGIVKSINEDTIEKYCEFIQNTFPTDEADWLDLKRDIVAAARKGPKIFVRCSSGKITNYDKMENIKIVAFLQEEVGGRGVVSKEIEGGVTESADNDAVFTLSDSLMIP